MVQYLVIVFHDCIIYLVHTCYGFLNIHTNYFFCICSNLLNFYSTWYFFKFIRMMLKQPSAVIVKSLYFSFVFFMTLMPFRFCLGLFYIFTFVLFPGDPLYWLILPVLDFFNIFYSSFRISFLSGSDICCLYYTVRDFPAAEKCNHGSRSRTLQNDSVFIIELAL